MILLVAEMAYKKFWFRYYCFSLFKADRVNRILMWSLIPFSLLSFLVSKSLRLNPSIPIDEALVALNQNQWYIYFNEKQFVILMLGLIVYNTYKHTRDSAIATTILVAFIYNCLQEVLGLKNKYAWLDVAWLVFMTGLVVHSIYRYIANARKR